MISDFRKFTLILLICIAGGAITADCYYYNQPRINCPSYVYAHRHALQTNISCLVLSNNNNLPERIRWYGVAQVNGDQGFSIGPGESFNNRYSFVYKALNGSAAEAILIFNSIDGSIDYRTYSLTTIVPGSGLLAAKVNLYERGQGKMPFQWWDYLIFAFILVFSAAIGVYYGFFAKTENTQVEYMLGGRQMGWLPVSLSLLASFMSAITLLGTPGEIYAFGTQYIMIALAYPFVAFAAAHIFLPIFYNLRLTSAYEYLELRFSKAVRIVGAVIFVLQMLIYMSMVIYMPSIALEAVIGMNFWFSALTTAVVCIFYTSMGGMKATMWTDAFQVVMMYIGLLAIFIQGCIREGGFTVAWNRALAADRVQFFEMNPDPRLRHSFWTMVVGSTFTWSYTYGVNQAQVQRGLSARSLGNAKLAYWLNVPGLILMMLIPALCGILVFSRYQQCDPVKSGVITKRDQLLVYYVMDIVAEDLPGIPGLFMATLFSAALSTISSGINGLAAVTCRDFEVESFLKRKGFSEGRITWIAKVISALYGGLCILLIFPIQYLPGLLESALGLFGALGGPLLGIYCCGLFVPFVNSTGALVGLIVAEIVTIWMTVGEKISPNVALAQRLPSISTMECDWSKNTAADVSSSFFSYPQGTFTQTRYADPSRLNGIENFYSISYLYLSIIGIAVSLIVGVIVSAITRRGGRVEDIDAQLIHPIVLKVAAICSRRSWNVVLPADQVAKQHDKSKNKNSSAEDYSPLQESMNNTKDHSVSILHTLESNF